MATLPAAPALLRLNGSAALHEVARAFAHVADFGRFTTGLENALSRAEFFADTRVQLLAGPSDTATFRGDRLTLPLAGVERLHGALRVGAASSGADNGGARPFGPEDLHLLSSLAAVLAAAMDHAVQHGELRHNLEVLSRLLDLAPVGLVALHAGGRLALANATARQWLGAESADTVAARLAPENLGVDWRAQPQFHLRLDGKLIYGEARSGVAADKADDSLAGPAATAFVFVDLSPQQAQLMDGLQRELYRCRWLGLKLAFVLLEGPEIAGGLLQRLPELRAHLQPGELAGPYDAHRIGLVLPGLDQGVALARLRALAICLPSAGMQAAVVPAEEAKAAERVLAVALAQMRPAATALRPALLLHDDYGAVNDMLALVLGRGFEIVKSTHYAEAVAHLRARPFDALVTEVDLREGGGGLELARLAKQLQPALRPIFTTVAHDLPAAAADPLLAGHGIIHKPFDLARIEAAFESLRWG